MLLGYISRGQDGLFFHTLHLEPPPPTEEDKEPVGKGEREKRHADVGIISGVDYFTPNIQMGVFTWTPIRR